MFKDINVIIKNMTYGKPNNLPLFDDDKNIQLMHIDVLPLFDNIQNVKSCTLGDK